MRFPTARTRRQILSDLGAALLLSVPRMQLASADQSRGAVKITHFEIHKVTLRWRDLVFLEIHTDTGLVGLGSAA